MTFLLLIGFFTSIKVDFSVVMSEQHFNKTVHCMDSADLSSDLQKIHFLKGFVWLL